MKTSLRKTATPRRRTALRANERRLTALHPRRRFLHLAAGAATLPMVSRVAWAQAYPTRPITIIVPFAAGGAGDVVARTIAQHMRRSLGQPVIIENVTGAAGSIGVGRLARSAPDGYTLDLGQWGTHVVNGAIYPLKYNVETDFEPVSLLTMNPMLIVAKRTMPADNLAGLIAWLKTNPGKVSQATTGAGAQVAGVAFQKETGTQFQFVPYRGDAPAIQDLIAGQIELMVPVAGSVLQLIRSGSIKAYAVMAERRLVVAPDIPTVDEAGFPELHISSWLGFFAPKGTPKNIIGKLNAATGAALADPAIRQRLVDLGSEIPRLDQQTPEFLGAFQKAEIEKWWPIIKAANIKGQ
jgi:tripartite-type tricarboxylate transporter receptor subunit TctC